MMKYLILVILLVSAGSAHAKNMTEEQITALAEKRIDEILRSGDDRCFLRYHLGIKSTDTPSDLHIPDKGELNEILKDIFTLDDIPAAAQKYISSQAKHPSQEGTSRTIAKLKYKDHGVVYMETLFDLPIGIDNPLGLFSNIGHILEHYADRGCPTNGPKSEPPTVRDTPYVPSAARVRTAS